MLIGSLGDIFFIVSSVYLKTITDLNISGSAKWNQIDILNGKPKLQFAGVELDSIKFKMSLRTWHSVNPTASAKELMEYMKKGKVLKFIMANRKVGTGKYIIKSLSQSHKHFTAMGTVISMDIDIELQEYN